MSEKDIRRNAVILEKLKNYPEIIAKYYQSLLDNGKSLGTARTYMASVFQFLDYSYGDHISDDFFCSTSENDIAFFLDSLKTRGDRTKDASGTAKAAVWSALMSLFSFISSQCYGAENPVEKVPRPALEKKSNSDLVYLTPEETKTLLQTVEYDASFKFVRRDKSILMLGLYCGLRINEILALNVDDVNLENGTLRIANSKKGDRIISISEQIQNELYYWLADRKYDFEEIKTDALFVSQIKARLSADMVQKLLNKYSREIGKHVTPRVLRNTFAITLYRKTGDVRLCAKYLDHESMATTQRYIEQVVLKDTDIRGIDDLYENLPNISYEKQVIEIKPERNYVHQRPISDIGDLDLTVRAYNCLKRANIKDIRDLMAKTDDELLKIRNMTPEIFDEVKQCLKKVGL